MIVSSDFLSCIQSCPRRRFVIGLFYVNLLWYHVTYSQRSFTSFGPCSDRALGYTPIGLSVRPSSAKAGTEIAVLSDNHPVIHLYSLSDAGTLVNAGFYQTTSLQQFIFSSDIDSDGENEYITLSQEGTEVSILKRQGSTFEERRYPIAARPQRLTVADVNNDGRKDILLFGRTMAGVSTLLGRPGGTFVAGPLLFSEVSVSDLKTTDLNGDGITDVLLLSWLSNQLIVFYGISRGTYSEQVTVDLPGEPTDLAVTEVTRQRTIRVAVTLPYEHQISILSGNAAGEFDIVGTIPSPGRPTGVQFANLNNDPLPDIISATDEGMLVCVATSTVDFTPPMMFGIGSGVTSWTAADVDGDKHTDLVLADRSTKRIVVAANAEYSGRITWPNAYAVGNSPHGLTVQDVNGDGRLDIAVVNEGSSSFSLLLNKGNGKMRGQQVISIPELPVFITAASSELPKGRTLITSHPAADKITVIHLADEISRSVTFAIPTGINPYVLGAREDSITRNLEIFVRNSDPRDASASLSLFNQISGQQFLERSLRPSLPNKILALTVDDFTSNRTNDLVFATHDKISRKSTISIAPSSAGFDFKNIKRLFSYSDSLASTRSIVAGYIDGDPYKDIVVILAPPRNLLVFGFGRGDGTFRDSLEWVRDVEPLNDDAIVLRDVDGDGNVDITVLDTARDAVVVRYGTGGGRFGPPSVICAADGINAIAIGALREANVHDLILSNGKKGTVSIMFAPFRRYPR